MTLLRRLLLRVRAFLRIYEEIGIAPYRRALLRAEARQRDAFLVATLGDVLGAPSPVELYTLELLPYLMEDFHAWHRRAGHERAPEGGWHCC